MIRVRRIQLNSCHRVSSCWIWIQIRHQKVKLLDDTVKKNHFSNNNLSGFIDLISPLSILFEGEGRKGEVKQVQTRTFFAVKLLTKMPMLPVKFLPSV